MGRVYAAMDVSRAGSQHDMGVVWALGGRQNREENAGSHR